MRPAFVAACVLSCACNKPADRDPPPVAVPVPAVEAKPEPAPTPAVEAPRPVPAPPPAVFPIDKLAVPPAGSAADQVVGELRRVVREVAPELGLSELDVLYVHKDGTLDPTYGALRIVLSLSDAPDGVVDDPARPTGAPIPEPTQVEQKRTRCPTLTFGKGAWQVRDQSCRKVKRFLEPCSVSGLWSRAIAEGAPADAVATIRGTIALDFWTFEIIDKVRKVEFKKYLHACAPPGAPASPRQR